MGFLFSPFGRVSLGQFWLYYILPAFAASIVANIIDILVFGTPSFLSLIVSLFFLWPSIAVSMKRFHDHGMTGWWVLGHGVIGIVAIVSGVFAFGPTVTGMGEESLFAFMVFVPSILGALGLSAMLYLVPGRAGGNVHGPDPAGRSPALSKVVEQAFDAPPQPAARPRPRGAPAAARSAYSTEPASARSGFGRRPRGTLNPR